MSDVRTHVHVCLYGVTLLYLNRCALLKDPPLLREWAHITDSELDRMHEAQRSRLHGS